MGDKHAVMAGNALLLGMISIPLCFFLNIGTIVGGIAIVLALLSKGTLEKLLPQAKRAIIFGTLGLVIGYGVFAYDMDAVMTNPEYRQQLNTRSEQMNGISFDDMLKELGVELDN